MELETRAIHAGRAADPSTGAISPPIYLSTTFERAADGSYPQGFTYSRTENPKRNCRSGGNAPYQPAKTGGVGKQPSSKVLMARSSNWQ